MPDLEGPNYNYSYIPTVDHRENNLFTEEYYSSTDTKIYFDDIKQTQIGYIQYELQEQLKPIYGYNSRTFDDIVIGNRIVTGTFKVPIANKENKVFENGLLPDTDPYNTDVHSSKSATELSIEKYNNKQDEALYNTEWFGSTTRNSKRFINKNIDSETLTKLIALGFADSTNISTTQYKQAIKHFQNSFGLPVNDGSVDTATKDAIDHQFQVLNAKEIDLDGINGYLDLGLTKLPTPLHRKGLLLDTIKTGKHTVRKVMDDTGKQYFIHG